MGDTDRDKFNDIIQHLGNAAQTENKVFLTIVEVKALFYGYVQMSETIEGLVAVVEGLEADAKAKVKAKAKKIWRP